jgi:hypothetical protein
MPYELEVVTLPAPPLACFASTLQVRILVSAVLAIGALRTTNVMLLASFSTVRVKVEPSVGGSVPLLASCHSPL